MSSPNLRDDFVATVELYSTFSKEMKAKSPQFNVSEVSFARGTKQGGENSYGKRGSSVIAKVSNAALNDLFFKRYECHDLTPEKKYTLRRKRLKRGHVGNV
jgi:hypothetical protein